MKKFSLIVLVLFCACVDDECFGFAEHDINSCPDDAECVPGSPRCNNENCYINRYAFVTSQQFKGMDLQGSTDNADKLCTELAIQAGLFDKNIKYLPMRAWISDFGDNALGPVLPGRGNYYMIRNKNEINMGISENDDSLLIASNFYDLLKGKVIRSFNRTEYGEEVNGYAWTNTDKGKAIFIDDDGTCLHWGAKECQVNQPCQTVVGEIGSLDATWSAMSPPINYSYCYDTNRFYCFEMK